MKVKECPECGGYVAVESSRCQNCGYKFWENAKPSSAPAPARENKWQRDMKDKRKVAFFIVCVIVAIILFSVAIFFLLGGGKGPSEIRFAVDGSSYSVAVSYLDGNGLHTSTYEKSGHFEWWVKGAMSASCVVSSDGSVTAKAYVDGRLVDQQSGTYWVQVSAAT